ncbi:MAG: hypothetical protein ABID09_02485 [Candidatus Omnitrophota bacterium]
MRKITQIFGKITQIFAILLLIVSLPGCGKVSEKTVSEVLEQDPGFENILRQKERLNAKALTLNNDFSKEKVITQKKIEALKEDLRTRGEALSEKVAALKKEIAPRIDALKVAFQENRLEYKLKTKSLGDSVTKLKNIEKLLAKKGELALSGDEVSIWNKRASELEREIDQARKEIDIVSSKIRLLKQEIRILED